MFFLNFLEFCPIPKEKPMEVTGDVVTEDLSIIIAAITIFVYK